jgi:hypothetical protein
MSNGDGLTVRDLWEVSIHVGPILLGLVVATVKILRVLDEKISEHSKPMVEALMGVEHRLTQGIEAIWKHEEKQDARLDLIFKEHYTFMGRHQIRCPAREGDPPKGGEMDGDGGD